MFIVVVNGKYLIMKFMTVQKFKVYFKIYI
jgi:hypothetical protein